MTLRLPLYGRALILLAINLLLLALLLVGSAGWDSLMSDSARQKLTLIGDGIAAELSTLEPAQWPAALSHHSRRHGVRFSTDGPKPPPGSAPPPKGPPPDEGPPPSAMDPQPPPGDADDFGPNKGGPDDRIAIGRSSWRGPYRIVIPEVVATAAGPQAVDVVATADSLVSLMRFLGIADWLLMALLALALSALLWVPFIAGMARSIKRVQRATQYIANGHFNARVTETRGDEIGALAGSVNDMAARLESYVSGQKQFLADVAHETISPLARIQLGLGLLEARISAEALATLRDVQDDATQMADLLNELLLFSRAGMEAERAPPELIGLRHCVLEAAERESVQHIQVDIDASLQAIGHPAMLLRALSNLIRNARKHGAGSPIEVAASNGGEWLQLWVRDQGPGVDAAVLARLGEPFFRGDASRNRQSGGYGLGLAIVRRCIAACGGEVQFRNRPAGGFEAEVKLRAA